MNETTKLESMELSSSDALIIVDIQNDFLKGGSLEVPDGNTIIEPINAIGNIFKERGSRIIFTQDWHTPVHWSFASAHKGKKPFDPITGVKGIGPILWPDHCMQGTTGANYHQNLDINLAHLIIRKGYNHTIDSYSCIQENDKETETGLDGYLKSSGMKRLFICGLALDYCVRYSAEDAKKKGYTVYVIEDLCRGIANDTIMETKKHLTRLGIHFINSQTFTK